MSRLTAILCCALFMHTAPAQPHPSDASTMRAELTQLCTQRTKPHTLTALTRRNDGTFAYASRASTASPHRALLLLTPRALPPFNELFIPNCDTLTWP